MRVSLAVTAAVLSITTGAAAAGPTVTTGVHSLGSLVMGNGPAGNSPARAGITAGLDVEIGDGPGAMVLVLEQLWRYPTAYEASQEGAFAVVYRHHFPRQGRGRAGFVGMGAGFRRLETRDDAGPLTMRGHDVRLEGGVALVNRATTDLHLRFGLTYGCYTRSERDGERAQATRCLDSLLGQMFIGLELGRRW